VGNFHNLLKGLGSACALAGMAIVATSASANLVPSFVSATTVAGVTTFDYHVTLDGDERIKTGDYFVIYDFDGFQSVTSTGDGRFSFTGSQNVGPYPPGGPSSGAVTPASSKDDGAFPNLVFTYNGATTIDGPTDFGDFLVTTNFIGQKTGRFGAEVHLQLDDSPSQDEGNLRTPKDLTPEAGSLALLLPGLVPVGMAFRRRIKRA